MAPRSTASLVVFLGLNLLFFTMVVNACNTCPRPKPRPRPRPRPTPTPSPGTPSTPNPGTPSTPSPGTPSTPRTPSSPGTPSTPGTPSGNATCPRDALKLGICVSVLNLINVTIGTPPVQPCCTLIQGLADLEAAICLCTAIRASILGININLPIALSLLLNVCGNQVPRGFQCS